MTKKEILYSSAVTLSKSVLPYAISYSEDYGAQISLYYAITASQVTIKYAVNNYLFGANGFIDGTIVTNENSANVGNTLVMDNSGIPTGANIKKHFDYVLRSGVDNRFERRKRRTCKRTALESGNVRRKNHDRFFGQFDVSAVEQQRFNADGFAETHNRYLVARRTNRYEFERYV